MDDLTEAAISRFRASIASREEGVQHDKRHHGRSACKFDVDHARRHARIGSIPLTDAMAISARIEELEAELAVRDAEIAAWLLSQKAVPIIHADDRIVANIATAIAAKAYRKDDGDE